VNRERGLLSLVSIIEELLEWKSRVVALKLALTSPTSGGRSVGIIRLRTKTTEFIFFVWLFYSLSSFVTFDLVPLSFWLSRYNYA
jgi:hypothetical protein